MAKIRGIREKIPKKKMAEVTEGLKTIYKSTHVAKIQKNFLIDRYQKYKKLYEDNLACDRSNVSHEEGNAWGAKDSKVLLKEKTDRIFELEKQIGELQNTIPQDPAPKKLKETTQLVKVELSDRFNYILNSIKIKDEQIVDMREEKLDYEMETEKKIRELESKILRLENSKGTPEREVVTVDPVAQFETKNRQEEEINQLKEKLKVLEAKFFFQEKKQSHFDQERGDFNRNMKILEDRVNDSISNAESFKGDEYMVEEIKSLSEAFSKLTKENKILINKNEILHKKNRDVENRLVESNIRSRTVEKQLALIEDGRKQIAHIQDQITQVKQSHLDKYGRLEDEIISKKTQIKELTNAVYVYKKDLAAAEAKAQEKVKKLYDALDEVKNLNEKFQENEKKTVKLTAALEAYEKTFREDTAVVDLHIQLQDLREYVYCALCKSNIKTHVIDGCMHCFCEDCLEHRLKTRNRNCPKCNKEYTKGDIKRVYL